MYYILLACMFLNTGWVYGISDSFKQVQFEDEAEDEEEEKEEEEEEESPVLTPTPKPVQPAPTTPTPKPVETAPPTPVTPPSTPPVEVTPPPKQETPPQPPTPAPTPQPKKEDDRLAYIHSLPEEKLCPFICDPPAFFSFFSPISCSITEIKQECLERCKGVKYGKKTLTLDNCKKKKDKPLAQHAAIFWGHFCWWACSAAACKNTVVTVPLWDKKAHLKFYKFPWMGKTTVYPLCKLVCPENKIRNCTKAAIESPTDIKVNNPHAEVELP